jgi:hypothetical protein
MKLKLSYIVEAYKTDEEVEKLLENLIETMKVFCK